MSAKQGEQYRIVYQSDGRTVIGQGKLIQFISTFNAGSDDELIVVDEIGDVVYASENVDYPRGKDDQYRNVHWIDEHPERFELIEASSASTPLSDRSSASGEKAK